MRINLPLVASAPPDDPKELAKYVSGIASSIGQLFILLETLLNGQITLGDGVTADNVLGTFVTYTTNAVPGTEDAIAHNLGVIPIGFHVLIPPRTGVINNGTTTWTTSNLYLKCTGAAQTVTLFVLIPPTST